MEAKAEDVSESAIELAAETARDLVTEQFDLVGKRMSVEVAAGLPAAKLAEVWSSLVKQLGPCGGLGEPWSEAKDGFAVLRVPVKFGAHPRSEDISGEE